MSAGVPQESQFGPWIGFRAGGASATQSAISPFRIYIGAAAVSDYRPSAVSAQKIKKTGDRLNIEMVRTQDVLADVAALPDGPFAVGFAAETFTRLA